MMQDCLAQQNDYSRIAEQHQVSYHQIYRRARKYAQGGWKAPGGPARPLPATKSVNQRRAY
ncbi:helix-turn-helix domain-containing protein [Marinococcus halophilus]|uniref:helix-turn-helix domain-containing protein n=1 Tax=Marinococcus halophilus TaxID=1371 RepID=UPI0021BFD606|nr:helix-turn-helix domain-containing protein [Marinococcus halophilus]